MRSDQPVGITLDRKRHFLTWAILLLLICNIGLVVWNIQTTPRVAFVRSQDLVYGYFGMREAMNGFQNDQRSWKSELDTLHADLRKTIAQANAYQREGKMEDIERLKPFIQKQENDLLQFQGAMEKKALEDEKKILGGVLSQVNSFVERYAQENGFDVVLGTTDSGSLLFADQTMDITDELLVAMNMDYEGAK